MIPFLCSLLWPLIESYWITLAFLQQYSMTDQKLPKLKILSHVKSHIWISYPTQIQWFAETLHLE